MSVNVVNHPLASHLLLAFERMLESGARHLLATLLEFTVRPSEVAYSL